MRASESEKADRSLGYVARWCGAVLTVAVPVLLVGIVPAIATATCPNERIRHEEPYGSALPDCRAYEQVSPVSKNNTDTQGSAHLSESSPLGNAFAYFSFLPFPGVEGASTLPEYVSEPFGNEWSTQGLIPPTNPSATSAATALTEDLNYAIVEVSAVGQRLSEASIQGEEGTAEGIRVGNAGTYIRNNATQEYRLLAPGGGVHFDDASRYDSTILFEDQAKLTKKAVSFAEGETGINLYEWKNGVVTLAGVLPNGEAPAGGSVAGPGGYAPTEGEKGLRTVGLPGGAQMTFELQHTISEDGSRVFFTDIETGQIYMHEPLAGRTIAVSAGTNPAYWRAATPSGSYVFYTEGEGANRNLYRFNASTAKREALTTGEAHVLGTLGVSEDSSYVYFVAEGVLASNENGHVIDEETDEKEKAALGQANLYQWHNGEPSFIAQLRISSADFTDWSDFLSTTGGAADGFKTSRVTPNGTTVLFSSFAKLTSYNNNNKDELYVYDAERPLSSSNPTCASCKQNAEEAKQDAFLTHRFFYISPSPRNTYLTNNLSSEGDAVFFQTEETLLPEASDGQMNVYEWEREGGRSCAVGAGGSSGGCQYLISTGTSPTESYFGDASRDGSNVFFFTRQSLVAQDHDNNVDVYDARVDGGLEIQNAPPPGRCEGDGCREPSGGAPVFGAPSSVTLTGFGNLASPPESKPASEPKSLTRAQKLAKALRACKKRPKRDRARCRVQTARKFGKDGKKGNRGGGR